MNIDEYRAMVASEAESAKQTDDQPAEVAKQDAEPVVEDKKQDEEVQATEQVETPPTPEKIKVDDEELTLEEIRELKRAGLRTQDYTKKTQELAHQRKELGEAATVYEALKKNPQVLDALKQALPEFAKETAFQRLSPEAQRAAQLEQQVSDLELQLEINKLSAKYPDFDVKEVINIAAERKIADLEAAYQLTVANKPKAEPEKVDVDAIKMQLREELLAELASKADTGSIIASNDSKDVTQEKELNITEAERKVARMQGLSPEDYVKWRDKKSK